MRQYILIFALGFFISMNIYATMDNRPLPYEVKFELEETLLMQELLVIVPMLMAIYQSLALKISLMK